MTKPIKTAVFLDRDGVLIEDVNLLVSPNEVRLISGAAQAVVDLKSAGFEVVVVTNQPIVARGLATTDMVDRVHARIQDLLRAAVGEQVTAFYYCPHHPHANLRQYRKDCMCRKPRPGLLHAAASDLKIDLSRSYLVGDRITDILAGHAAHVTTILVESGKHLSPPIVTTDPIDPTIHEDYRCPDLSHAVTWILDRSA